MNKVKLGIIGFGNIGTHHTKILMNNEVPDMELAAICDIAPARIEAAKQVSDSIMTFQSATDMFKSGKVDAVLIATPHYFHPALAIEAFSYGLHVLIEKPAGVYTKQVIEMNRAAEKSGRVFGIMYNLRTNPLYQKVRKLIQDGELGSIKRINWIITDWYRPQAYHDSCKWRSTWKDEGGGTLINQNPHQIDLWQWLFGMPDKVMSHCSFGKYYDIEVEDDVTAYMEYESGATGVYITSTGEYPGSNRLEIACDMGKVVVENNQLLFYRNTLSEREFNKTNKSIFATPECWKCEVPAKGVYEQHAGILRNFANAVLGKEELLAPGYEGINGLTISNAIHYSAFTGGWADIKNFPHDEFYDLLQDKIKSSTVVKKDVQIVAEADIKK